MPRMRANNVRHSDSRSQVVQRCLRTLMTLNASEILLLMTLAGFPVPFVYWRSLDGVKLEK